ncbi:MAG: glycosyltransferase family 39 protein [Planctomycetia bacterium]|nr:glycosyltransferase family 39 protein [Planctomycetia bacterium]
MRHTMPPGRIEAAWRPETGTLLPADSIADRRRRWALAAILLLAFVVRLAAANWWQHRLGERSFGFADSESYWALGQRIAQGKPYAFGEDKVFRTPGYPVVLSAPIRMFGAGLEGIWFARMEAAVLGLLAVGGVWCWARMLFDDRTALVAAGLAAIYPGAISTSTLILSEAPFCPLMVANLVLWTRAERAGTTGGRWGAACAAGMLAGLATLMRPSWLLFAPFALTLGMLRGGPWRPRLELAAAMLLGLVLVMSPWWVRNWQVVGRFVPTSLQVGASLYDGLNPKATGASEMSFVPEFSAAERAQPSGDPAIPFEVRLDRRMRDASVDWAQEHLGQVVRLMGVKFLRMWNVWPNEPSFSSWPLRVAILLSYGPILALAIIGAVRYLPRGWPYILCVLPAVYFTLLHTIFVSSLRYREPAMFGLIVLAAAVLSEASQRGTRQPERGT